MKNIFAILCIGLSSLAFSQIAIGRATTSTASVSLEFGAENRGLILPWVDGQDNVTSPVNGTIIFDAIDKKVKVKIPGDWMDLTINEEGTTTNPLTSVDGLLIQTNKLDSPTAKTTIGVETSTEGILVLESTTQAMVLPKVTAPETNILNPTPGLMVYDQVKGQLAVFNGSVWTYWKP